MLKEKFNKKIIIAILLFIVFIVLAFLLKDNILRIIYPKKYKEVVSIYTEKYQIEENLIYAVIKAESDFNTDAVSNRNAIRAYAVNGKNCERYS